MRSRRAAGQGLGFLADDAAERAVYVISVAAELAGMHPQTLRMKGHRSPVLSIVPVRVARHLAHVRGRD